MTLEASQSDAQAPGELTSKSVHFPCFDADFSWGSVVRPRKTFHDMDRVVLDLVARLVDALFGLFLVSDAVDSRDLAWFALAVRLGVRMCVLKACEAIFGFSSRGI
jgi:hypothetical protein